MRITRRGTQIALGGLWLLDGALQLQPYMLGKGFAFGIIAPSGVGQPGPVSAAVHLSAQVIATHPVLTDVVFALVQLGIGLGLLWPRTVRPALAISVAWAGGVWLVGEGLGGLLTGQANLLDGAPGAALLYAVLAVAAWPRRETAPAVWLPKVWAVLWVGLAGLQLLPGQLSGRALAADLTANTSAVPRVVALAMRGLAGLADHHPIPVGATLACAELAIGLAALRSGKPRGIAVLGGAGLALFIWVFAEGFGGLATGQATDPNSGPLLILVAGAVWASSRTSRAALFAYPPTTDLRALAHLAA